MSPLRLRGWRRRPVRRLAIVLALLAISAAMAAHHAVPSHMGGMAVGAMCLAVLGTAAAAAAPLGAGARVTPRPTAKAVLLTQSFPEPKSVPARAGPRHLELLVLRR